ARAVYCADGTPAWLDHSIGPELTQQLLEFRDRHEGLRIALPVLRQAGVDALVECNLNHQHVFRMILAATPDGSAESEWSPPLVLLRLFLIFGQVQPGDVFPPRTAV